MINKDDLERAKNDILSSINERMEKLEFRIFTLEVRNDQLEKENKTLNGITIKLRYYTTNMVSWHNNQTKILHYQYGEMA